VDASDPDLDRELADARVSEAVARRRRRRRRESFDAASVSAAAILTLHAARHEAVTVHTVAGGVHRGTIRWVGDGIVVLLTGTGGTVLVTDAISHLDAAPLPTPGADVPLASGGTRLGDLLAELAGVRAEVSIEVDGGEVLTGRLEMCGSDVCGLQVAAGGGDAVYVWLSSVTAVSSSSIS